jgi:hypothetical protein
MMPSRGEHPASCRLSAAGTVFTDRDQVDDVPWQASTSAATILPVLRYPKADPVLPEKTRMAVPVPTAGSLPRA